jgi:O-antigen/teichoic acid export membrane protein
LFKNIGSQWIRMVVFIVVGLIVPPLMNRFLGKETYGAWGLVMATTGLMKLLALGVPIATVRAIAAANTDLEINRVIGTSKRIFFMIGLIALVVGAGLFAFFELAYVTEKLVDGVMTSKISAEDAWAARVAFGLVVAHVALTFACQLPYAILAGKQKFVQQNKIMIGILLFRVSLIVGVLTLGGSLVLLAVVELITVIFEFVFPWRAVKRLNPGLRFSMADFDPDVMKSIFSFGGYMVLMHIGMKLAFQTDALVVGWGLNAQSVIDYNQSNTFIIYLIELMIGVGSVIMPMATKLQKEDKIRELENIFHKWSKITFSLALLVGSYLLVMGPAFVAWWMRDITFFEPAKKVVPALMLSCFVFLPIRAVTLPMLLGLGKVKFPAILFLVIGVLNVGMSMALIGPLGLYGVALGTAIPNVIYAVIVLVYACRQIDSSVWDYFSYVIPRCTLGALPVIAGLLWIREQFAPRSFIELFLTGIVMVIGFAIIWVGFVYRGDKYVDLQGHLSSFVGRFSK